MRGLFRAFEREGVDQLLIGGQAAILYGAAHFTQDLDLWIRPDPANVRSLVRALVRAEARVHKLTPPLSPRWVGRGHGFHFVLPDSAGAPAYLDVLGMPPRVGPFGAAAARARRLKTPWGRLPVVSIEDLVELKKTNRPGDYEAISRLVRIRLSEAERPERALLAWALRHTFRIEDLAAILAAYPDGLPNPRSGVEPEILKLVQAARRGKPLPERHAATAARAMDRRMARLLDSGRRHWLPLIADLRRLRSSGRLLPEGLPLRDLPLPLVLEARG